MFNRTARLVTPTLDITDLRFAFNIEKSLIGYPNLANIRIYNLSDSSRNSIRTRDSRVQLFAGYEDTSTPLIFDGDIVNVIHIKEDVDWVTTIYAADGLQLFNDTTVNKTLPAGTSIRQVFNEMVDSMRNAGLELTEGVVEGVNNCLSGKRSLLRELVISGNVKDWLDKIASDCGFEYSINDRTIETVPTGLPVANDVPTVINQNSGMLESPERTEIGINVKNLLLPELKLGRTIRVESINTLINVGNLFFRRIEDIRDTGVYRINKLTHVGDTRGNDWYTYIETQVFNV